MKNRKETFRTQYAKDAKVFAPKNPCVLKRKPVEFIPAGERGIYLVRKGTFVLPIMQPVLKKHGITW